MGDLKQDGKGGRDYILTGESAWVTVGAISVYIKKTDEGVVVDLYPTGDEMNDSIASTYAFFDEAKEFVEGG